MTTPPLLVGPMIHLGTLPPFGAVGHTELMMIALETDEVVFAPDQWIVEPGGATKAMHMIVDGYARVVGPTPPRTVGPGGLVGFPDILVGSHVPSPGVRTDTDVLALRLDTDSFRELCARRFAILSSVLSYLAGLVAGSDPELSFAAAGAGGTPYEVRELDRVGRMLALYRAPALPGTSMDALAELAGQAKPIRLAPGEELWAPGVPADAFVVVSSGTLELVAAGRPKFTVGPGGVPGLPEGLSGLSHAHRASALEDTTALSVSLDAFMDLVEDHYELAFSLLGWLSRHLVAGRGADAQAQ